MENNVHAEKIIVKYEDGTERELDKGLAVTLTPAEDSDEATLSFDFVNFSGADLTTLIYGMIDLGVKMGVIGDEKDNSEEEEDAE